MALKKSELYSSLWASCDELRGGMDASQYKDYVLVLLFVKYISDRYAGQRYAAITVPKGASFADMVALKGKPNIGDDINKKILGPLAQANSLSEMPDFNDPNKLGSGKEMVERLTNLIAIFENPALDFSKNRADGDDLLGDAYEYLMRHFATESGKSKGQFYTPAEVSRVIAQIIGIRDAKIGNDTTVYDPTCGSGSLLLKVGDEARHGGKDVKVTLYGQEKDNATASLARMNMILHDYATALVKQGNTLANPLYLDGDALKTFDYVVANPPFSDKRWSTGLNPNEGGSPTPDGQIAPKDYGRFAGYGIPPAKQGDYAYLLHILRSLKPNGKGACILPHGVLFRGNAEAAIRKNLVQRGVIKGIIGLPANLFYGTGIPACIVVLDKEGANARKGIFMIDASKRFIKEGNKNRLREQDTHRIVDTFTRQADFPRYSRMVPVSEISDPKNDYNLNLPRYIDSTEPEDLQDIDAHLRGGIPDRDIDALANYWRVLPAVRAALFSQVVSDSVKLPNSMHAAYGDTHFATPDHVATWPESFAIITAHERTGENWSEQKNLAADAALESVLRQKASPIHRATGFSPTTLHAEPGWAVSIPFDEACEIGARFKQDAIYFVQNGMLHVSHCDARRKLVPVGNFMPRLHFSAGIPVVRPGYSALRLPIADVKSAILSHAEFKTFNDSVTKLFTKWKKSAVPQLKCFDKESHPKPLIETIAEDLLETFKTAPLVDAYDIYQHLMDYWAATMQDDCYLIAADGWTKAAQPKLIHEEKSKKTKAKPDFVLGKKKYLAELVPPALIVRRWFADEQAAIEKLETDISALQREMEGLEEEYGAEEGAFSSLDKINRVEVSRRLDEVEDEIIAEDKSRTLKLSDAPIPLRDGEKSERDVLLKWINLDARITELNRKLKAAQEALTEKVAAKYPKLAEDEIKTLAVDDKWLGALTASVQGELDRVSQSLTRRVRQLAERYATPLPQLTGEVAALAARVDGHLKKMGGAWK